MEAVLTSKSFEIICRVLVLIFKALYAWVIYKKCNYEDVKKRNILTFLSIPFPIITGIICIIKNKKNAKNILIILISFVLSLAFVVGTAVAYTYNNTVKYYDKEGNTYYNLPDMVYTDAQGNTYTYDFDKTGFDYLYINSSDKRLNADWCYLDGNGYVCYDDDMSITAKSETFCADEDGSKYYPVPYSTFNKDGTIDYSFNSSNFKYDRLGNAYTYDYVPYYDKDGNKYFYTFDSNTQKSFYTNISTKETFDNEYCFVDEKGYFVFDKEHSFTEIENKIYTDLKGKKYYWASGIYWNKDGKLLIA